MMSSIPSDSSGPIHAWLFEAKGIQRWLFSSGRLRDVVGGSDLVARIADGSGDDLIGLSIGSAGLVCVPEAKLGNADKSISFSRRAGGSFCIHSTSRDTLMALRRDFLQRFLTAFPGLECEDAIASADDELGARDAAHAAKGGSRKNDLASLLPLGRPVFAANPRAGLPQTGEGHYSNASGEKRIDRLDRVLAVQRQRADALQGRMGTVTRNQTDPTPYILDGAAERFQRYVTANPLTAYPRNLEEDGDEAHNPPFPWIEGSPDRRIALVHVDISGLGQAFQTAAVDNANDALKLGTSIETAILQAIGEAMTSTLSGHTRSHRHWREIVPARPIVVGGDDITVLVRADLALAFAAHLLVAIEAKTRLDKIPCGLSACAGVAISRAGMPFLTLNALADGLCAHAKKKAKMQGEVKGVPWPSLLAFHVQSQTADEDYEGDILSSMTALGGKHHLTANPFAISREGGEHAKCALWDSLCALALAIDKVPGAYGTFRTIAGELARDSLDQAEHLWRRFWTRGDRSPELQRDVEALKTIIEEICSSHSNWDEIPSDGAIFDALELIDLSALPHLRREAEGDISTHPTKEPA